MGDETAEEENTSDKSPDNPSEMTAASGNLERALLPVPGETKVASLQEASEVREETTKVDSDVQDTAGAGGADSAQVQPCTPSVEEKPPASPTTSTKDGGVEGGGQSDSSTESCAKASEKSADNQIMIDIMNKMAADADKRAVEADKRAAEALNKMTAEFQAEADKRAAEFKAEANKRATEFEEKFFKKFESEQTKLEDHKTNTDKKIVEIESTQQTTTKDIEEVKIDVKTTKDKQGKLSQEMMNHNIKFDDIDKKFGNCQTMDAASAQQKNNKHFLDIEKKRIDALEAEYVKLQGMKKELLIVKGSVSALESKKDKDSPGTDQTSSAKSSANKKTSEAAQAFEKGLKELKDEFDHFKKNIVPGKIEEASSTLRQKMEATEWTASTRFTDAESRLEELRAQHDSLCDPSGGGIGEKLDGLSQDLAKLQASHNKLQTSYHSLSNKVQGHTTTLKEMVGEDFQQPKALESNFVKLQERVEGIAARQDQAMSKSLVESVNAFSQQVVGNKSAAPKVTAPEPVSAVIADTPPADAPLLERLETFMSSAVAQLKNESERAAAEMQQQNETNSKTMRDEFNNLIKNHLVVEDNAREQTEQDMIEISRQMREAMANLEDVQQMTKNLQQMTKNNHQETHEMTTPNQDCERSAAGAPSLSETSQNGQVRDGPRLAAMRTPSGNYRNNTGIPVVSSPSTTEKSLVKDIESLATMTPLKTNEANIQDTMRSFMSEIKYIMKRAEQMDSQSINFESFIYPMSIKFEDEGLRTEFREIAEGVKQDYVMRGVPVAQSVVIVLEKLHERYTSPARRLTAQFSIYKLSQQCGSSLNDFMAEVLKANRLMPPQSQLKGHHFLRTLVAGMEDENLQHQILTQVSRLVHDQDEASVVVQRIREKVYTFGGTGTGSLTHASTKSGGILRVASAGVQPEPSTMHPTSVRFRPIGESTGGGEYRQMDEWGHDLTSESIAINDGVGRESYDLSPDSYYGSSQGAELSQMQGRQNSARGSSPRMITTSDQTRDGANQKYKEWFKNIVTTMIKFTDEGYENLSVEDVQGRYTAGLCLACGADNHDLRNCRDYRTARQNREDNDATYKNRLRDDYRGRSISPGRQRGPRAFSPVPQNHAGFTGGRQQGRGEVQQRPGGYNGQGRSNY